VFRFTYRNIKVYLRDRTNVLFSLMAAGITVGIYILFLRDVWLSTAGNGLKNAEAVMDSWLMGGMLSVLPVTLSLGAFSSMVDDRERRIDRDFICSPLSEGARVMGYLLSVLAVTVVISLFALALAEWYIVSNGGDLLSLWQLVRVLALMAFSSLFSAVTMYFFVSFLRSQSAFLTLSIFVGVAIGFLTGCYVPLGMLPESVQWVVKLFPPSHTASLLRQVFLEGLLPEGEGNGWTGELRRFLGVEYEANGHTVTAEESLLFLLAVLAFFVLCLLLRAALLRRRGKTK